MNESALTDMQFSIYFVVMNMNVLKDLNYSGEKRLPIHSVNTCLFMQLSNQVRCDTDQASGNVHQTSEARERRLL